MRAQQEFEVLGSTPLLALRDAIGCARDHAGDAPGAMFYIEGVCYNDTRAERAPGVAAAAAAAAQPAPARRDMPRHAAEATAAAAVAAAQPALLNMLLHSIGSDDDDDDDDEVEDDEDITKAASAAGGRAQRGGGKRGGGSRGRGKRGRGAGTGAGGRHSSQPPPPAPEAAGSAPVAAAGDAVSSWANAALSGNVSTGWGRIDSRPMAGVCFRNLSVRLGAHYLFQHQGAGACEHIIIFTDCRLHSEHEDGPLVGAAAAAYPLLKAQARFRRRRCTACAQRFAH